MCRAVETTKRKLAAIGGFKRFFECWLSHRHYDTIAAVENSERQFFLSLLTLPIFRAGPGVGELQLAMAVWPKISGRITNLREFI